jgi:hypothetical protein
MKHLTPLEPCPNDGAYQYLTVRERKKSFEVVLLHQAPKSGQRQTRVVAKIPRFALKIHEAGYQALRNGGSLDFRLREIAKELMKLSDLTTSEQNGRN